ncbi:MAG TPA: AraC family transcriptional regulator [Oceanipulchritudo sp.]|nr:AraC family transcriptional regulator [Oceanipulchritudo sp.]
MNAIFRINQDHVRLSSRHPVRLERTPVKAAIKPHHHDYYEILIVTAGTGVHLTAVGRHPLKRGSLAVLAPGQVHAFEPGPGLEVVNIYYLSEWLLNDLRGLWDQEGLIPLFFKAALFRRGPDSIPEGDLTGEVLDLVINELRQLDAEQGQEAPSLLMQQLILLKVMVLLARTLHPPGTSRFASPVWSYLQHVEAVINRHQPPGINRFAHANGISRDHFRRLFTQATGMAPMEYFQHRRIQIACGRLLDPSRTITTIAHELGFTDAAHFSARFSHCKGCSPRAYRKQFRF